MPESPPTPSAYHSRIPLRPLPHTAVTFHGGFWGPRVATNRERTLPAIRRQLERLGRFEAVERRWRPGTEPEPRHLWTTDIAEWIEVASLSLATHPDPYLEARIEEIIPCIRLGLQPDGYLDQDTTPMAPGDRWRDMRDNHRLYTAGHVFEAAVAHYRATGRRDLLDIACRYADHVAGVFGPGEGRIRGYDGHPEIELALVKLYRATGEERYLRLAGYFVHERGRRPNFFELEPGPHQADEYFGRMGMPWRPEYNQSHAPVREQAEVVGHAVRAMYLYSAMADLAGETGDGSLLDRCRRLWRNLASRRLYVIGGLGSTYRNEGMTADYDLPNETAYCETCAAVGLVFWSHRMLHADLDGRYADLMERALYNNVAAGVSLDGERFFYDNKLASRGDHHRTEWFEVACCPPNVARLFASLGEYQYSVGGDRVVVHLYARGEARFSMGGQRVILRQETDYPWDGGVGISLEPERPARFSLVLRIPGWCRRAELRVNGEAAPVHPHKGYVTVERMWSPGDVLALELAMPVERVRAHPRVAADVGRVALQRGPVVYCLEQADNGENLEALSLPGQVEARARFRDDLLGGVVTIGMDAERVGETGWGDALYRAEEPESSRVEVTAVPYAAWDNREPGEMAVWVREG